MLGIKSNQDKSPSNLKRVFEPKETLGIGKIEKGRELKPRKWG